MSDGKKYRLVTRSDFDGLVCAVLLKEIDLIDEIKFVHPKDMQDKVVEISKNDITTNLPYVEDCFLAFDHHESEFTRNKDKMGSNYLIVPEAPSAARVVFDYYGGRNTFKYISDEMMKAVDKADSAQFTIDDILMPSGWELLSFIMDSRTGLGRFREFTISNYQLMMKLIDYCRNYPINEILEMPDVAERVEIYMSHMDRFEEQINRCSKIYQNLVVLDLREEEVIFAGNRFVIYGLFPKCNISIHRLWGLNKQKNVFAAGKSIFNRSSKTDIGQLMLKYGGGGHIAAGTCQIENDRADAILDELISQINEAG
jgi:nanoRNase/pAp phosphatase (c-di-AMP/oligoRNAs hydrolase)